MPAVIESPAPRWSNGCRRGPMISTTPPSSVATAGSPARDTTTSRAP